jgi:hypothetical protein
LQKQLHVSTLKGKSIFEISAEFLLAEMKAQGEAGGGRILLGDNTGGGAVMLRPVRFHCLEAWISTGLS